MTSPDIFLSYNRDDQATARRFAEALRARRVQVWWDQTLRSGEAYDEVTEGALRGAKAVVVLWSKKSVVSRWVRAEATLADRNRTLVPAMIESCERPIMFELTQTADLVEVGRRSQRQDVAGVPDGCAAVCRCWWRAKDGGSIDTCPGPCCPGDRRWPTLARHTAVHQPVG